ncbi:DUF1444 family protein [Leptospira barantonii]|uniref:DUF1444 family protein n=1 Tax=Leptospira barantonii TaxID=2023184 RepID=UPI0013FD3682|nr:DUF1444 family protein [Leptospira barantonii]
MILFLCVALDAESKNKLDEKEFQSLVITVLAKRLPQTKIRKADDKTAVYINEIEYSLSNLYRLYQTSTGNDEELIFNHFEKSIRMAEDQPKSALSWEKAKTILMPQIIRQEYAKENRIFSGRIFGSDLVVSYVLNYKEGYRYVLEENQTSWNVSEEELFRNAVDNLDRISRNVKFLKVNSGILAIRMQDSYDASRILLPKLRERIAKRLGNDFEFALPKRDFLICWSRSLPQDVKKGLAEQVDLDFQSGAYSISKEVFVGNKEGIRGK